MALPLDSDSFSTPSLLPTALSLDWQINLSSDTITWPETAPITTSVDSVTLLAFAPTNSPLDLDARPSHT